MSSSAIFIFGLLVTVIAVSGLVLTVLEFREIERKKEPGKPNFPL